MPITNPDRTYIISDDPASPHSLTITRDSDDHILIRTNNREMYGVWGTFGFDLAMATQLRNGLSAVLSGHFDLAISETTLRLEAEESARRAAIAARPSPQPTPTQVSVRPTLDLL